MRNRGETYDPQTTADQEIAATLERFQEAFRGNVWRVQGTAVIYHKALERIAAKAGITWDKPQIIRAKRDEAVMMVFGRCTVKETGEVREEWSVGEALINVNYRVSGKQAAYVWAMAEKRAKDRVILKLINLSGLIYSEAEIEEEDEPRKAPAQQPRQEQQRQDRSQAKPPAAGPEPERDGSPSAAERWLRWQIDRFQSHEDISAFMRTPDAQAELALLSEGVKDRARDYVKERMTGFGWKPSNVTQLRDKQGKPAPRTPSQEKADELIAALWGKRGKGVVQLMQTDAFQQDYWALDQADRDRVDAISAEREELSA